MEQQKKWEQDANETGFHSTRHSITFRNIHDVEWTTNPKPLARIITVEQAAEMNIIPIALADRIYCQLCNGTGRYHMGSLDDVRVHLQDV